VAYIAPSLSFNECLLFAQESAIGTDASPPSIATWTVSPVNRYSGPAWLAGNYTPNQPDVKMIPVNPVRTSMTGLKDIVGRSIVKLTFDAYLQGNGGSGGQMPWWVPLVESCGHTIAAGNSGGSSSWILTPTNTPPSLTFYHYAANQLQKILGAFGTVKIALIAGDGAKMSFSFMGIWQDWITQTIPTLTMPGFYARQCESEGFTVTPSGASAYTPICPEFDFDTASKDDEREDINSPKGFYGFYQSDRDPKITAIVEREVNLTNIDWNNLNQQAKDCAIAITHGSVTLGSTTNISAGTVQIAAPTPQDKNKRQCWQIPMNVRSITDNGEYTITIKEKI
jgi:hypothetical protein